MFHIPGLEHLIMKLRFNRPFMRISRVFVLSLIALMVLGCVGEWGKANQDTYQFVCSRRTCYEGQPFTLTEYVERLNGSSLMLEVPLMGVLASLLLLFMPSRTYLAVLLIAWASIILLFMPLFPSPFEYQMSSGQMLTFFSAFYLAIITMPLAVAEQTDLHASQWLFWKKLFP